MGHRNDDAVGVPGEPRRRPRRLKVVADREGSMWLCDEDVDETRPLREQGCWQSRDREEAPDE